jgi:hypothetical protein
MRPTQSAERPNGRRRQCGESVTPKACSSHDAGGAGARRLRAQ